MRLCGCQTALGPHALETATLELRTPQVDELDDVLQMRFSVRLLRFIGPEVIRQA